MKHLPALLLAVLTAIRLVVAARLPVTPLEAYYGMCAQRLDWAFFDGPGGLAAIVHATTAILGDGPLGLRIAFPLFAAGASYGAFLFGRALFGSAVGLWAAVALNVLPIFQSAAVHAGPEMPALAFLLLAAWAFVRALDYGIRWWTGAGFCVMLAEQFQTAAILLTAGFVLVCLAPRRHRGEWRRPGIYFALYLTLTGIVPVFLWNQMHDWPALALGTLRTTLTPAWREVLPGLGATFRLLSVPAALLLGALLFALVRDGRRHFRPRIALLLIAPFLAFWLFLALHGNPAAPWVLATVFALAVAAIVPAFRRTVGRRRLGAGLLVLTAGLSALGGTGEVDPWSRSAQGVDWQPVAISLAPLLEKVRTPDAEPPFVIAPTPEATAALDYHLPVDGNGKRPDVFLRESQDVSNQFGLWPRYDDFVLADKPVDEFFKDEGNARNPYLGRSALYLTDEEPADLPQTITSAFVKVTPFATVDLGAGRKLRVYLCADYQTMPL